MQYHFPKHHLILGVLALVVAASLIYSFSMLRVANIAPDNSGILVPPVPPEPTPTPSQPDAGSQVNAPVAKGECRPSGCSGQLCADEDMVSDCAYLPEYACYKKAKCERQADGRCGWTQTAELRSCLFAADEARETVPE